MTAADELVWKGRVLWLITAGGSTKCVGEVIRDEHLVKSWGAFVRGARVATLDSEAAAQKELEARATESREQRSRLR